MKKFIIDGIVNYVMESNKFNEKEEEIIRYGIANLYLQISKIIVISVLAIIFKIFIPYIIFTIIYNIVRCPSFGVHAKKSYQCWISSILFFIGLPLLSKYLYINTTIKMLLLSLSIIYITIYSPADTEKRPIVSKKRRILYKYLSTIISIIYSFVCLYIKDQIVSNLFLFSLILQCIIISPITYKIFGVTYDNYKEYQGKEELVC